MLWIVVVRVSTLGPLQRRPGRMGIKLHGPTGNWTSGSVSWPSTGSRHSKQPCWSCGLAVASGGFQSLIIQDKSREIPTQAQLVYRNRCLWKFCVEYSDSFTDVKIIRIPVGPVFVSIFAFHPSNYEVFAGQINCLLHSFVLNFK